MLRLNVATDQLCTGRWTVHLFAGDGDEHIYQFFAGSPVAAARRALDSYDLTLASTAVITSVVVGEPRPRSALEYPNFCYTEFTVDG